jgi:hypothetical protein
MNFKLPVIVGTFLLLGQSVSNAEIKSELNSVDSHLQLTKNILSQMGVSRAIVWKQLETARSQHDIVKSQCLNDKVNQLDVAIQSAHDRKLELQIASERGDTELVRHEFTVISILEQRTKQFISEATHCIGHDGGFVGEISIKTTIDPSIPAATTAIIDNNIIVQPPTCSSCFK